MGINAYGKRSTIQLDFWVRKEKKQKKPPPMKKIELLKREDAIVADALFYEAESIIDNMLVLLKDAGPAEERASNIIWSDFKTIASMMRKSSGRTAAMLEALSTRYGSVIDAAEKHQNIRERVVEWLCGEHVWEKSKSNIKTVEANFAEKLWEDLRIVQWCAERHAAHQQHPLMRWVENDQVERVRRHAADCGVELNAAFEMEHKLTARGYLWQVAKSTEMIQTLMSLGVDVDKTPLLTRKKAPKDLEVREKLSLPQMYGITEWSIKEQERSSYPKGSKRRSLEEVKNRLLPIGKWSLDADRRAAIVSLSAPDLTSEQWAEPYVTKCMWLPNGHPMLEFWKDIDASEANGKYFEEALQVFSKSWHKECEGEELWTDMLAHAAGVGMGNMGAQNQYKTMVQESKDMRQKLESGNVKHWLNLLSKPGMINADSSWLRGLLEKASKRSTQFWHQEDGAVLRAIQKICETEKRMACRHPAWSPYMEVLQTNSECVEHLADDLKGFVLKNLKDVPTYAEVGSSPEYRRQVAKLNDRNAQDEPKTHIESHHAEALSSDKPDNKTKLFLALMKHLGPNLPFDMRELEDIMSNEIETDEDKKFLESVFLSTKSGVGSSKDRTRRAVL
jgi:hypothetical protein